MPAPERGAVPYPTLLSPLQVGPVRLPNRVVMSGHSMGYATPDGTVGARYRSYLATRARGGTGLVMMSSAPVHPSSRGATFQPWLWLDETVAGMARVADEVHAAGARLGIILWHGGHNSPHLEVLRPLGPSPVPSPVTGDVPREMSRADIREIVAAYASAARRCADAGLDVLEIQTASDYLLGAFLNPHLNRRNDEYGGSAANRVRFAAEVLEAVRAAVPAHVAVGIRTCAEHLIPLDPGCYGVDDSLECVSLLDERGLVDWVSVMNGSHWEFAEMIPPMHVPRAHVAPLSARYRAALAAPVFVAGRIRTPAEAEALLAAGDADAIAMARTLIADPDWAAKAARGEAERIRPCMSCNQGCIGFVSRRFPGSCTLNVRAGREFEPAPQAGESTAPRRVAVVGGGPAGLEAARIAASRGHRVTLYEARAMLGGDFRLAAQAPHRGEMQAALAWWERELQALGVTIRCGVRVDSPAALDADAVVWAVGARPGHTGVWRNRPQLVNGIPGSAGLPHGRELLAGERSVSGRVLVIDEEGGWSAVSLVETLAADPRVASLTVLTDRAALGLPDLQFTLEAPWVAARLRAAGVTLRTGTLVARIEAPEVVTTAGERLGPFDAIVLSTGTAAAAIPEGTIAAGDCVTPRGIWAAVTEGLDAGSRP
jgi:2,4-dienoyl-CoA reductase-like NADH-dependent reductase (Old Yellow Enzyme family)